MVGAGQHQDLSPQDFLPIRPLGHGDMGTVFLVQLCRDKRKYAMKVVQKEALRRKGEKRAAMEHRVLGMVSGHPFLPTLHAHFQSEKHIFFVIDYCSGGDLNVLRHKQPWKRFTESAIRFYAAEVVAALEYLHSMGIIYRDLKPENVLIRGDGHIMLSDFDLSIVVERKEEDMVNKKKKKRKNRSRSLAGMLACVWQAGMDLEEEDPDMDNGGQGASSRCHSMVGTEEYVAPEVLWGHGHGFSVDWWTFGIFLHEMAYGSTPFKGPHRKDTFYNILCLDPSHLHPRPPLNDLIRKLLSKDPHSRLGSSRGAADIKKHPFFKGTSWDRLHLVARPPFVPSPPLDDDGGGGGECRVIATNGVGVRNHGHSPQGHPSFHTRNQLKDHEQEDDGVITNCVDNRNGQSPQSHPSFHATNQLEDENENDEDAPFTTNGVGIINGHSPKGLPSFHSTNEHRQQQSSLGRHSFDDDGGDSCGSLEDDEKENLESTSNSLNMTGNIRASKAIGKGLG